jgi:hypothetical protein
MTPTKQCSKCEAEYPATSEYFHHANKNSDGLRTECKLCRIEDTKRYREAHREELREKQLHYSRTDRGREQQQRYLEANQEAIHKQQKRYYDSNREKILEQKKHQRQTNPEIFRERRRQYRQANPEKFRQSYRSWRERNRETLLEKERQRRRENPETTRERDRQYYQINRERILEQTRLRRLANPERHRAIEREWRERNRDILQENERRYYQAHRDRLILRKMHRYTRKRALPDTLTIEEWRTAIVYWENRCAYCEKQVSTLTMDHYVALSCENCPGTVVSNILPACRQCNSSKCDNKAWMWLVSKFGEEQAEAIQSRILEYFAIVSKS